MLKVATIKWIKNVFKNSSISIDLLKIELSLKRNSSFYENRNTIKNQLQKNYNCDSYTEKALLKRLQYLQNGLGLYHTFFISILISGIFFVLSLITPQMLELSSDLQNKVLQHQYLLNNNVFYAEGYKSGILFVSQGNKSGLDFSIELDELNKDQEKHFWEGYNYAINDGYGYSSYIKLYYRIFGGYFILMVITYYVLKLQEKNFNKYQLNDFEIELIKSKLGITEGKTKHLQNKTKKSRKKGGNNR